MSLATIVGLIAVAITVFALVRKTNRGLLLLMGIGVGFWAWHYWLMGSTSGAVIHGIAAVGIFVAHGVQQSPLWFRLLIATVFIKLGLWACFYWGTGWADVFAGVGCVVMTLSQFVWRGKAMRAGFLSGEVMFFFFAFLIGSYPGMAVTLSNVVAGTVGLIRMHRESKDAELPSVTPAEVV